MSKLRAALGERRVLVARVRSRAQEVQAAGGRLRQHYRRHSGFALGVAAGGGFLWGLQRRWRPPRALLRKAMRWGRILLVGLPRSH